MNEPEADTYGDIAEYKGKHFPRWLWIFYIGTPLWAILWWFLTWNGAPASLDPDRWSALEEAAHTTYPYEEPQPDPARDSPYIRPL